MEIDPASHMFIRQNTCSHSTRPPASVAGSQPFDQPLETDSDDISAGITTVASTVSQRRRVNPENLALKLGPDLVRDLEALIQPGNIEMPSFAVRKELQERYNIDRRHIYDYFHSRGLRVIKEDKHGNAIVPNDLAPAPSVRALQLVTMLERDLYVSLLSSAEAEPPRPHSTPSVYYEGATASKYCKLGIEDQAPSP